MSLSLFVGWSKERERIEMTGMEDCRIGIRLVTSVFMMTLLVTPISWQGPTARVDRSGSSSDLICLNISYFGGGYGWCENLLGWLWRLILIPSSLLTSCSLHSMLNPAVLALGDSFLKVRPGMEAWVDNLGCRSIHAFEAPGHLFGMKGLWCDIIMFLHIWDEIVWLA